MSLTKGLSQKVGRENVWLSVDPSSGQVCLPCPSGSKHAVIQEKFLPKTSRDLPGNFTANLQTYPGNSHRPFEIFFGGERFVRRPKGL